MDSEQLKGIEGLLKKVSEILPEIEKRNSEAEGFNVFRLCGVNHYETMHSKILAEFLNPQGSHGQKTRFLDCFCKMLGLDGHFTQNTIVLTEVTGHINGESIGRFDILIEDRSTLSVCLIENKIFAGEQTDQLERYAEWLREERKNWKTCLVFLTLNGRKAHSIKDQNRYQRLAYVSQNEAKGIIDWIDLCLKEIQGEDKPFVESTLQQYKKHITNLATGEQAMCKEII